MISYPIICQQFNLPYKTIGQISFHCLFKPTFVSLLHWTVPYLYPLDYLPTYICVMKTNLKKQYLPSVYFATQPLHISGTFVAHHQLKSTTRTNCCIYTVYLLMMGYKYAPKHVEAYWRNKLRTNSGSNWFSLHGYIEMHGQQNIKSTYLTLPATTDLQSHLLSYLPTYLPAFQDTAPR
jgi:hypothetical protein